MRREGLMSHLTTGAPAAHSGSLKALSKKRPQRPLDEKAGAGNARLLIRKAP